MELQPLSREHIDGIMEIENDSFSIPWSRGSMEKELENKLAKLQEESSHDISEVREIFLNHNVNKDYKIRWKKPAKNDIIDFLCEEHGFSQDRVSKACDKLKNLNSSQKSLEDWF